MQRTTVIEKQPLRLLLGQSKGDGQWDPQLYSCCAVTHHLRSRRYVLTLLAFLGLALFFRAIATTVVLKQFYDQDVVTVRQESVDGYAAAAGQHERIEKLERVVAELQQQQKSFRAPLSESQQQKQQQQEEIPSCRSIMLRPDSPFSNGEILMRETTAVTWIPRADGSRKLTVSACKLHRYTAAQARECLTGEHVMSIGDSLTRYLTLSLAYFLHHGDWGPRFTRENMGEGGNNSKCLHWDENGQEACSKPNEGHLLAEGTFHHAKFEGLHDAWERLHALVGGWTDGGVFNGQMECSCARSDSRQTCTDGTVTGCLAENLLYVSQPLVSKGEGNSVTNDSNFLDRIILSFVSELGWGDRPLTIKGFNFTGCAFTGSCRRDNNITTLTIERSQRNDFDYNELLEQALQPNGIIQTHWPSLPTIAFYNRGLWGEFPAQRAKIVLESLFNTTSSSLAGKNGRCFFRGTTGSSRTPTILAQERSSTRDATFDAGCTFLDLAHVTADFSIMRGKEAPHTFWDLVHYLPWVYEEINNLQLNVLCNSKVLQSDPESTPR